MQFLIILAVLFVVVLFVSAPLRQPAADTPGPEQAVRTTGEADLAELEAAREAKYREIRDAELDYRTGKLSDEDYRRIDATLRTEAIEILDALEAADGATMPTR